MPEFEIEDLENAVAPAGAAASNEIIPVAVWEFIIFVGVVLA